MIPDTAPLVERSRILERQTNQRRELIERQARVVWQFLDVLHQLGDVAPEEPVGFAEGEGEREIGAVSVGVAVVAPAWKLVSMFRRPSKKCVVVISYRLF